jgi:hypothetical protein
MITEDLTFDLTKALSQVIVDTVRIFKSSLREMKHKVR